VAAARTAATPLAGSGLLRKVCRFLSTANLDRLISAEPRLLKSLQPTVVRDYAEEISTGDV
jgi:hypothetical protein